MANRWFNQFRLSLEKSVVELFSHVTFGATGAPTLNVPASKGIKSITKTGTGTYDIELQDTYYRFLLVRHTPVAAVPAAPGMIVTAQTVSSQSSPKVSVEFRNPAGAATDPGNGDQVFLEFSLSNSSAL